MAPAERLLQPFGGAVFRFGRRQTAGFADGKSKNDMAKGGLMNMSYGSGDFDCRYRGTKHIIWEVLR